MDFWFPHSRQALSVQEVCTAFGISPTNVRAFVEEGAFVAVPKSANPNSERQHVMIERWSVIAWRLNEIEDSAGSLPPIDQTPWVQWWRQVLREREQQIKLSTPKTQIRNYE